jgi:hypothetical protein
MVRSCSTLPTMESGLGRCNASIDGDKSPRWGHELPQRRKFAASALPPKAAAAVADRRGS